MENRSPHHLRAHVTTRTEEEATVLARGLLEAHLAACVHLRPVRSLYRWQGAIHSDEEHELVITTTEARWEALLAFVRARHTYEVPQIIATPIRHGHSAYLAWVDDCTTAREERNGGGAESPVG